MQPVVLSINQRNIEIEKAHLKEHISIIKNLSKCFEDITGKKEITSITDIENTIKEKSGFIHIESSAKLLGILDQYNYIKDHINLIDFKKFNISEDYNVVEIKESVLEEIKEANTSYLRSEMLPVYKTLLEAVKKLNSVSNLHHKAIKQKYDGSFEVNPMILHNSHKV